MTPEQTQWLAEAYLQASKQWEDYRRSGDPSFLSAAARSICGGFQHVMADAEFWAGVLNASQLIPKNRDGVELLFRDLDAFVARERTILNDVIGDAEVVTRLTTDLATALALATPDLSGESIVNLQSRVVAYRDRVCASANARPMPEAAHHGIGLGKVLRRTARGLLVVGGLVVIGGSILGADATPPGLAGVAAGAAMIGPEVYR